MLFVFPSNSPGANTLDRCDGCAGQIKELNYPPPHHPNLALLSNLQPQQPASEIKRYRTCIPICILPRRSLCRQVPCNPLRSHSSQSINQSLILRLRIPKWLPRPVRNTNPISTLVALTPLSPRLTLPSHLLLFPPKLQQQKNPTHGENSPSLCPTISSVIVTS